MKKFIGIIIMITIVILFSFPDSKAQTGDTVKIRLSVDSDVIQVNPSIAEVQTGTVVLFFTEDPYTFTVTIDNYDNFFLFSYPLPSNILNFSVTSGRPIPLTVNNPPDKHDTKDYLIGISNPPDPIPLPPEAPPRIIIR